MKFKIVTTYNDYKDGKAVEVEREFPKVFKTFDEAYAFGAKMFEPPQIVTAWRVVRKAGVSR